MTNANRPRVGILIPTDFRVGLPPLGGNLGFVYSVLPHLKLPVVIYGFGINDLQPTVLHTVDNAEFVPLAKIRFPSRIPVRLRSLFWYWRKRKKILSSVDVLYAQQLEATLPFLIGKPCIPMVYHQHDVNNPAVVATRRWGSLAVFRWFFAFAQWLVYKRATMIVAVDPTTVELARSLGVETRVSLFQNCVDDRRFYPSSNLRDLGRQELGIGESEKVVLVAAVLRKQKRIDLAIHGFALLASRDRSLRLLIAGDGAEEASLKNLCAELNLGNRVTFAGHVLHDDMPRLYNAVDVLLLTSVKEGSPMVILEAIASGTPVAATPSGRIREVVANGKNGIIVDDPTPEAIASALSKVLQGTWDRQAVAESIANLRSTAIAAQISALLLDAYQGSNSFITDESFVDDSTSSASAQEAAGNRDFESCA